MLRCCAARGCFSDLVSSSALAKGIRGAISVAYVTDVHSSTAAVHLACVTYIQSPLLNRGRVRAPFWCNSRLLLLFSTLYLIVEGPRVSTSVAYITRVHASIATVHLARNRRHRIFTIATAGDGDVNVLRCCAARGCFSDLVSSSALVKGICGAISDAYVTEVHSSILVVHLACILEYISYWWRKCHVAATWTNY